MISINNKKKISTLIGKVSGIKTSHDPSLKYDYEIPYVATYYFEPIVYTTNKVTIPIYITDYNQEEYRYGTTEIFTFNLRLEVDGNVTWINDLCSGDHILDLGILSKGNHHFNIEVTDQFGKKSCRLFNEILVVDENEYIISQEETYTITDADLNRHSINKNDSNVLEDMINCRNGLTALLSEIRENGYRKCILPKGIYRVNRAIENINGENAPIDIPSGLTVDLNKSTIKLHPYDDREYGDVAGVGSLMLRMKDCIDSHIVNGTLEGDYAERQEMMWKDGTNAIVNSNGEHNRCFYMYGGKYNSFEDITMKQITGYSLAVGMSLDNIIVRDLPTFIDNIAIDETGNTIIKDGYCTCDYYNLQDYLESEYISINIWLSFGGIQGEHWDMDLNFYDINKTFIEGFKCQQHRRVKIPQDSQYIRVTFRAKVNELGSFFINNSPSARYCTFKNIEAIDNRTCLAPNQFQHLLYENIKFTRTGQSITPCVIDLEDGWDQAQDFYLRRCSILEPTGTADLIDISGINHVVEDCNNFRFIFRGGINGLVVKNNDDCNLMVGFGMKTKNTIRIFNNENLTLNFALEGSTWVKSLPIYIKDNNIVNSLLEDTTSEYGNFIFSKNNLTNCTLGNSIIKECEIYKDISSKYIYDVKVYNCNFYSMGDYPFDFSFNKLNVDRVFSNCNYKSEVNFRNHNWFNSGMWHNCTFEKAFNIETSSQNYNIPITFTKCTFKGVVNLRNLCKVKFVNCTFLEDIFHNNNSEINTEFVECIYNKTIKPLK